ncbi:plasmid replication protein RepC [Roseovarius sp. MMSF_3281]|uniref:plasmid replication protein RepC n=1 Tax=Roseovarius sp. MMSF_3281 TaxID=3046694 RepID=UPI0027400AFA|nr:plasmid replication protein RepC [Roseovarius sp. MMSF_3281]
MDVLTTTPFGQRAVSAALMEHTRAAQAQPAVPHVNKWELFRELCTAKSEFNVSDRDLTVLNALLSFHRDTNLSDNDMLIVFPSNAALAERAHGMAESTLRRHLAALVNAGLLLRHDSPNGKRYAVRDAEGGYARAFGLDLRPLLVKADKIAHAASEARAAAERMRRLREELTLLKRDAVKLLSFGQDNAPQSDWEPIQHRLLDVHKTMRRRLTVEMMSDIRAELRMILDQINRQLVNDTEKMSGKAAETERHYHNSNTDSYDSELHNENCEGGGAMPSDPESTQSDTSCHKPVNLPLALVLKACPDLLPYVQEDIRTWRDLIGAADFVRGMMGVSPDAWREARNSMGPENAAIVLACILQKISDIHSPGGYLRALSRKADLGKFSPGPMVMALLNTGAA